MTAIQMIDDERSRQIQSEGWTPDHDDGHTFSELARAASAYAMPDQYRKLDDHEIPVLWPWDAIWWKPTPEDRIRELVKAGALIVAEIERIQRNSLTTEAT